MRLMLSRIELGCAQSFRRPTEIRHFSRPQRVLAGHNRSKHELKGQRMDDRQRQLTEFLDQRIGFPRQNSCWSFGWQPGIARPSPFEFAKELIATSEFQAVGLGAWFGTPEGEFFTDAVEAVSPPFYRPDEELLIDSLKLAAGMQRDNKRIAGLFALGVIAVGVLLISRI